MQEFPDSWTFAGPVRKKYEQMGNAVPLGLGEAAGRALRETIEQPSVIGRQGKVECWNLDLLTKLTRRPRTIVNPPRMRCDTEESTISDWYEGNGRMRRDALAYAPPELEAILRKQMRLSLEPIKSDKIEDVGREDIDFKEGDEKNKNEVQLVAAE